MPILIFGRRLLMTRNETHVCS